MTWKLPIDTALETGTGMKIPQLSHQCQIHIQSLYMTFGRYVYDVRYNPDAHYRKRWTVEKYTTRTVHERRKNKTVHRPSVRGVQNIGGGLNCVKQFKSLQVAIDWVNDDNISMYNR